MKKRLTIRELVEAHKKGYFVSLPKERMMEIRFNSPTMDDIMERLCDYENIEEDFNIDIMQMFDTLTETEISEIREKIKSRTENQTKKA